MKIANKTMALVTAFAISAGGLQTVSAEIAHAQPNSVFYAHNNGAPEVLTDGSANWDFVTSFREYVGIENETRTAGAGIIDGAKQLEWQAVNGQAFDPANPGQLKFTGSTNWSKYDGFLNVTISNPTIDFVNKKLLVDASTNGTMSGAKAATFTQQALLDMQDLQFEVRDDYLLVYSHKPVITDLSEKLVGFYKGSTGAAFVATFNLASSGLGGAERPDPVLWKLFPNTYTDPQQTPPLTDPNEATFEVNVPDAGLRKCIFDTLEIPHNTAIVNKVLQQLQTIKCIGVRVPDAEKITDLTGLEYARNMSLLQVSHHKVKDLSPLANATKLHTLSISNNEIESLEPLKQLSNLGNLTAANNKITSVAALKNLEELTVLRLNNNRLTSLTGVPYNVQKIEAENNRIADISGISFATTPRVRELILRHNRIQDVSSLAALRVVSRVDLRNNFITDPSPLAAWENHSLSMMRLDYNKFTDWSTVANLPRIDAPRAGESGNLNPLELADLLKQDAAEASAEAEAANPVVANNAQTAGYLGDKQRSDNKEAGQAGLSAAEMFTNTPAGASYVLRAMGAAADTDSATVTAASGRFELDTSGVVTFTPAANFVGAAQVQVVLKTLANNEYVATYTAEVKELPTPAVTVDLNGDTAARQGTEITFVGGPFVAGETVTVEVHSNPVQLGTFAADVNGMVTVKWQVPATFAIGEHTAIFTGKRGKTANLKFTVAAPKPAAPTPGSSSGSSSAAGGTGVANVPVVSQQSAVKPSAVNSKKAAAGLAKTGDALPFVPLLAAGLLSATAAGLLVRRRAK